MSVLALSSIKAVSTETKMCSLHLKWYLLDSTEKQYASEKTQKLKKIQDVTSFTKEHSDLWLTTGAALWTKNSATAEIVRDADVGAHSLSL